MKIAFVDTVDWNYRVESAYQRPLGGSQSALCYLAEALSQQNHEVFLLNQTLDIGMSRGVTCLNLNQVPRELLQSLDVAIALNSTGYSKTLRSQLGEQTCLVLWTQHDTNQPAMQPLQDRTECDIYDAIICVSEWQRQEYCHCFGIPPDRIAVFRNAIAPVFTNLFEQDVSILNQKSKMPILAYTSTPFRGLDILLEVFPEIRKAIPKARLQIFSSMRVYQASEAIDREQFGDLYDRCHNTEGVEYIGSLPQPELAKALKSVSVLAYPNTFAETSCIAVMEAIASGCKVITSNLGALPETTHGFAELIEVGDWTVYKGQFVNASVQFLGSLQSESRTEQPIEIESQLRQQVDYINRSCTWSVRATEWSKWLMALTENRQVTMLHALQKLEDEVEFYEQAIANDPQIKSNYWHLGLTLLLLKREEDAQMVWFSAISEGTMEESEQWTAELIATLNTEAKQREAQGDFDKAWLVRQYIYANAPEDIANLFALGNLHLNVGQIDEAIACFYKCLLIESDRPEVLGELAKAYQRQGKISYVNTSHIAHSLSDDIGIKLNLGCGENHLEGFINVDKFGNPDLRADLEVFPWQWSDNSVGEVVLKHVLEHLGATPDIYFGIFKELYRICKPNARIYINVPHPRHDDFMNDPTHVRAVTPEGLMLFSQTQNRDWIAVKAANSPLGLYLDVNFELVRWCYDLDEPWRSQFIAGKVGGAEMLQILKQFNNVAKQIEMELVVVKR
ncbi:glycosyltransferase [Tumidithrix elongata RA019]|uniref:Glycosyltransferase n=1 Tax=Tumidithrix elongata BACA0141 TaxID=2716417 RepID=A0AAW9Q4J0_9CYAN|nr:glycosyltransferase [Tumidithrix elongata RA019]